MQTSKRVFFAIIVFAQPTTKTHVHLSSHADIVHGNITQGYMTLIRSPSKTQTLFNTNCQNASRLKQKHPSTRQFSHKNSEISLLENLTVPRKPAKIVHYLTAAAGFHMLSIPW